MMYHASYYDDPVCGQKVFLLGSMFASGIGCTTLLVILASWSFYPGYKDLYHAIHKQFICINVVIVGIPQSALATNTPFNISWCMKNIVMPTLSGCLMLYRESMMYK